jgi:glycosyltransferase involved in cell wall biosynthesis
MWAKMADRDYSVQGEIVTGAFADPGRTHVLMVTNHGVHEWKVIPGLPDTGGQNVYVNQFSEALVAQGYRVTIVNRGGYPNPSTGRPQVGTRYHPSGHARILYLEDGDPEFVRKEDMAEHIPALVTDLQAKLASDADTYQLIISHYWDAGALGASLNLRAATRVPHVWVPHSLGALKKRNMDPSTWHGLRIDERIQHEKALLPELDGAVATSTAIRDTFLNDYGYMPKYLLPPCVDIDRYRPRAGSECDHIFEFLAAHSNRTAAELRTRTIVTEISRTDRTKRKDVLINAFARVHERLRGAFLVVALDPHAGPAYDEAAALIHDLHLEDDVAVLGSVWEQLPCLYAVTAVYCTPSVMEGFGMSAEEAAATGKPVIASDLVPFATEHLLGGNPSHVRFDGLADPKRVLLQGEGAIVVPADDVEGFAHALEMLLSNDQLRADMGDKALGITVPYFTWERRTRDLLNDLGVTPTHNPAS